MAEGAAEACERRGPLVVASSFFDSALPPDALQLATVRYELEDRMKNPASGKEPRNYVPFGIVEQTDWRAVRKLLK